MSLINDALKRAAEAEKRQTGARRPRRRAPKGAEALGPMIHAKPVKSRRDMLFISPAFGLIMIIILMAGLSTYLLHNWWTRHRAFNPVIPAGMDPLEYMIVDDPRRAGRGGDKVIVVGTNGVIPEGVAAGSSATTNNAPVTTPPAVQVTQAAITNRTPVTSPVAPAGTNTLPSTNLIATVIPSVTSPAAPVVPAPPPEPETPANNNTGPVTVPPIPRPIPTGPVIVRPRGPEGHKSQAQINAEEAARERARMQADVTGPVMIGPNPIEPRQPNVEFPEINVVGIIVKQESASAYVNGKVITLGDQINGAELVEISDEYLTFAMEGAKQKFYLPR